MRNLQIFRKFTSGSALPLPGTSVICLGEPGYLMDAIGLGVQDGDPNPEHFLSNLIRISEFAHIEELVKSSLLHDIVQMQFMVERGVLYLSTRRGAFLHFPLNLGEVEELFMSETGLTTFAVSPDSRLVVLTTKTGTMLLLSLPDLELICEEVLLEPSLDSGDGCHSIQICWRHDSRYFGLNVPNGANGRKLKIYDEHGALFSSTEDSISLCSDVIAWQPSGGLIASIEKLPAGKIGTTISFFELNGLKRSEFNANEGRGSSSTNEPVLGMAWNAASDILVLRKSTSLELWHRSNYMWMLKGLVSRAFRGQVEGIKFFSWDRENAYKLHVVFESGYYSFYDFNLHYNSGFSGGSCLSVSINGNSLYCTPFRDNCGPPPCGFYQVSVEATVKEVVISSFWDGFMCVLSSGKFVLVRNDNTELKAINTFIGGTEEQLLSAYNWIWPNSRTLCCIRDNKILVFQLPESALTESSNASNLTYSKSVPMNCSSMLPIQRENEECSTILVRKHGGSILLLDLQKPDVEPQVLFKVPADCFHNLRFLISGKHSSVVELADNLVVIGHDQVTKKLEVFSKDKQKFRLASDCNSMTTFDDYVLYTTVQGTLEIVHVAELLKALTALIGLPNGHKKEIEIYSRKVEKGAVILSCCWNKMLEPTLVLQILPRGNLETIFPRPLVISSIQLILRDSKKRSFKTIMAAMRRHRIDANILLDELKQVEKEDSLNLTMRQAFTAMVEEVTDPNILVLFVTEISSENMDAVHLMKSVLEEYTKRADGSNGIQPYLATMAKLGLYEEILHSPFIFGESDREVVKSRVKFLSFYAENSEILYEAALGTYDLSLTSIVADCLNKDPKEFLPILNELKDLPLEKRCFSIDNTLKRWTKGVRSLIRDSSVQCSEIIKFIERHRLYTESLNILAEDFSSSNRTEEDLKIIYRAVENSYGQYLENHGKLREASIFYRRAGSFSKAIECCVKNGSWELALTIAFEEKQDKESYDGLCKSLLAVLEDREEFENAARLCEVYKQDYRLAVEFWTRAKKWAVAHALTFKDPELSGLVLDLIKPKLIESELSLEAFLTATKKDVVHYTNRLEIVKEIRKNRELEGGEAGDNFSDTESVATTASFRSTNASSTMTGNTRRSSKNRRKLERKLYSLKEGSQFEDIAITVQLWEIFTRVQNEVKKDVAYTIESLWIFGLDEKALALTDLLDQLTNEVDASVKKIWSCPLPENPILESKYRIAPINWTCTWDKLSFSSVSPKS